MFKIVQINLQHCTYDQPGKPPPGGLRRLVEHIQTKGGQLLLGCDANSHHIVWGSTGTNSRGESFLDYIISNDLEIVNKGNEPTFFNKIRREVIDITVSTRYISTVVKRWHVSDEPSLSDHKYILFEIESDKPPVILYRDPKRTDWDLFREQLGTELENCPCKASNPAELELMENNLRLAITTAFNNSCSEREKRTSRNVTWWNEGLSQLRTKVRKLFNRTKYSGNWEAYRAKLTEYNLAIRKAKRDSWRKYCQELEQIPESARLQRALIKGKVGNIGSLKKLSGDYTEGERETMELLLQTHFPNAVLLDENKHQQQLNLVDSSTKATKEDWTLAKEVVNQTKIKWAVKRFLPFKSPGPDGIIPAALQQGIDHLAPILCETLRASLALGYIPEMWRKVRAVFIPKPGRETYAQAKSFRPISLTSFLLKLLERLIDRHIRDKVLVNFPLHKYQYAYQAGKSCEMAICEVISRVEKTIKIKEVALGAFLDIEGAFDNTSFESINRAAAKRGIHPTVCKWITSMLKQREIYASSNNKTIGVIASRGCPQGGVLSPLLWCLVVDELLRELNDAGFTTIGYADDVTIIVTGKFTATVSEMMQGALNVVKKWCNEEGLTVNPAKTTIVPFTRRRKLDKIKQMHLYDKNIEMKDEVKYLGVTLDKTLTFKSHVEKTTTKATRALWACRQMFGKNWGLSPAMTYWIYTAMIKPIIEYASTAWWHRTQKKHCQDTLNKVQRIACLGITGAMSTTPTAAMETLLNLPPLHLQVKARALSGAYRQKIHSKEGKSYIEHSNIYAEMDNIPILQMVSDRITRMHTITKTYRIIIPEREEWEHPKNPVNKDDIIIYTDGSKNNKGTGLGIHGVKGPRYDLSIALGIHTTIFQAEIYAIIAATQLLLEENYANRRISIVTDSQTALKALNSCETQSGLVLECIAQLNVLGARNKVKIIWVPGHSGIEGNRVADHLAKIGANLPYIGPEPACGISPEICKQEIKTKLKQWHREYWQNSSGQRQAKTFLEEPSEKKTKSLLSMSRQNVKLITGLLTGHCAMNKHLYTIGLKQEPICRGCGEDDETPLHLICQCEAFVNIRQTLLGAEKLHYENAKDIKLNKILEFVKKTGTLLD